jgi:tetratricopeptide (TPR) repeat protein
MRYLLSWFCAALGAITIAPDVRAYAIDYAADRPPELVECDASRFRGERGEAGRCYAALLVASDDPRIKAEAAWATGNVVSANNFFREAEAAYPEDPRLRVRWGKLFEATFAKQEVFVPLYQEALALDSTYPPAILAIAELAAGRFEGQARDYVGRLLDIDADNIGAHLLLARMELEVGNLGAAEASLDRAFKLIEGRGLPPVEVFALRASADLLNDVFESEWIERALAKRSISTSGPLRFSRTCIRRTRNWASIFCARTESKKPTTI